MTVQIFGLNLRDQRISERRKTADSVRALLVKIIFNQPGRKEALEELTAIRDSKRTYSMAAHAVLEELRPIFSGI